ncbi:MAG: DUF3088 family protein [Vicinamibacteria bacterium]
MLKRDQLFLLAPDFADQRHGDRPFFCPETALVEGMLAFYPKLRAQIDIHYVGFAKPRLGIIALLGEAVQNCPVLVMGEESLAAFSPRPDITVGESLGQAYISRDIEICRYLAHRYGVGLPHP